MELLYQQFNPQNIIKFIPIKPFSYKAYSSSSNPNLYKNQNYVLNQFRLTNDKISTSADNYSYQNFKLTYENQKILDASVQKNKFDTLNDFFKIFGEKNELSNFSIFQENIDIKKYFNLNKKIIEKITLNEYFQIFFEASCFGINIPFLDKNKNILYNVFNPTLSSMNLIINRDKIKNRKINNNKNNKIKNYVLTEINDNLIKLRFNEKFPYYNRDTIEKKIKDIHNIFGKRKILLKNIDKNKSYFSILWTPVNNHILNTSFLSIYTFDYKLIGTLIKNADESNLFMTFNADSNSIINKDYKKEYLNNITKIDLFIKKCNDIDEGEKLNSEMFSQDYRYFIYNY